MHRMDPHAMPTPTHAHTHKLQAPGRCLLRGTGLPGALWAPCHPQVTGLLVAVDLLA